MEKGGRQLQSEIICKGALNMFPVGEFRYKILTERGYVFSFVEEGVFSFEGCVRRGMGSVFYF